MFVRSIELAIFLSLVLVPSIVVANDIIRWQGDYVFTVENGGSLYGQYFELTLMCNFVDSDSAVGRLGGANAPTAYVAQTCNRRDTCVGYVETRSGQQYPFDLRCIREPSTQPTE